MIYKYKLEKPYSPLYFLASVGSGGLAVSFFMYLLFMTPHKGSPIPYYETLMAAFNGSNQYMSIMIAVSVGAIAFFAFQNVRLLVWNLIKYRQFLGTEDCKKMRDSNAEIQRMAIPLALAMTVNVLFIVGAVFVPGLWQNAELLFPYALATFGLIALYAGNMFFKYMGGLLANGGFDCEKNNSLAQMLSVFAFAMIAVGFSASGAMSHDKTVSIIGLLFAGAFATIALFLGVLKVILGFRSMFNQGVNKEAAVSLWIIIPILTILGIAFFRIDMGFHHNFEYPHNAMNDLTFFTAIFTMQIFFGLLGHSVMKRTGYYSEFINGSGRSPVAYAAICPGVALFVMANFLINMGLVKNGFITKFSPTYFALYIPLILLQLKTVWVLSKLNYNLLWASFGSSNKTVAPVSQAQLSDTAPNMVTAPIMATEQMRPRPEDAIPTVPRKVKKSAAKTVFQQQPA